MPRQSTGVNYLEDATCTDPLKKTMIGTTSGKTYGLSNTNLKVGDDVVSIEIWTGTVSKVCRFYGKGKKFLVEFQVYVVVR